MPDSTFGACAAVVHRRGSLCASGMFVLDPQPQESAGKRAVISELSHMSARTATAARRTTTEDRVTQPVEKSRPSSRSEPARERFASRRAVRARQMRLAALALVVVALVLYVAPLRAFLPPRTVTSASCQRLAPRRRQVAPCTRRSSICTAPPTSAPGARAVAARAGRPAGVRGERVATGCAGPGAERGASPADPSR